MLYFFFCLFHWSYTCHNLKSQSVDCMTFCLQTCQINFIAVSPLEFVEDENDCIAMQILVYGDVLSHRTSCKFQASVRSYGLWTVCSRSPISLFFNRCYEFLLDDKREACHLKYFFNITNKYKINYLEMPYPLWPLIDEINNYMLHYNIAKYSFD